MLDGSLYSFAQASKYTLILDFGNAETADSVYQAEQLSYIAQYWLVPGLYLRVN